MTHLLSPDNPMLLFGCGNMGRAMLDGWLRAGIDPAFFVVVDPFAQNLPAGVALHADASTIDRQFSIALLAIKPQIFGDAARMIIPLLTPNALVLSLLAGTRCATLQVALPERRIVRLMPNLAAALGKSPIGLFSAQGDERKTIDALLAPLGISYWMLAEEQMDAVTALAGSGPAFVYRFIDALAQAGVELGLDPAQSLGLAKAMVQGAAELAATENETPQELARRVTSPGGTTAAGLSVLDSDDALLNVVKATLTAARDRGVELSKS